MKLPVLLLLVGSSACTAPAVELQSVAVAQAERATACPVSRPGKKQGKVASDELDEISGLVASQTQPGVFWTHNDSGDEPRVFAIDGKGKQLAELGIAGAAAKDWEDIALLRSADGPDQLVLADIGDNWHKRESVQLYLVPEPRLSASKKGKLGARARRLEVRYEDGSRDAETLLADPLTGDLYIVAKAFFLRQEAPVGVYRISAKEAQGKQVVARRVAQVSLGPVTAGDVRPDGRGVVLRNYTTGRYFERKGDQPLFEAFVGEGCELALADLGDQGEALCFAHDGRSFFTVAEGSHQALYRYELRMP